MSDARRLLCGILALFAAFPPASGAQFVPVAAEVPAAAGRVPLGQIGSGVQGSGEAVEDRSAAPGFVIPSAVDVAPPDSFRSRSLIVSPGVAPQAVQTLTVAAPVVADAGFVHTMDVSAFSGAPASRQAPPENLAPRADPIGEAPPSVTGDRFLPSQARASLNGLAKDQRGARDQAEVRPESAFGLSGVYFDQSLPPRQGGEPFGTFVVTADPWPARRVAALLERPETALEPARAPVPLALSEAAPLARPLPVWIVPALEMGLKPLGLASAEEPAPRDLVDAVWREMGLLPGLSEHLEFARRRGVELVTIPFAGRADLALRETAAAQWDEPTGRVYLNWDVALRDWRTLRDIAERSGQRFARDIPLRVLALGLIPVVVHELRHGMLRFAFGRDFPAVFEEEILTHRDEAVAFAEILRAHPSLELLGQVAAENPFFALAKEALDRWDGGLEGFVPWLRARYREVPGLLWEPLFGPDTLSAYRRLLQDGDMSPAFRTRLWRAIVFLSDPLAVADLTDFLITEFQRSLAVARR